MISVKPSIRRVGFIYDADYYQTLASVATYLESQGIQPDSDYVFRDSGHTLEIDSSKHFAIKESPEWQELIERYEQVGCLYPTRL